MPNPGDVIVGAPGGEEYMASFVRVEKTSGGPVNLILNDGTTLRVEMVINAVARLNDKWADNGNPMYVINSANNITVAEAPEELKKPEDKNGT